MKIKMVAGTSRIRSAAPPNVKAGVIAAVNGFRQWILYSSARTEHHLVEHENSCRDIWGHLMSVVVVLKEICQEDMLEVAHERSPLGREGERETNETPLYRDNDHG